MEVSEPDAGAASAPLSFALFGLKGKTGIIKDCLLRAGATEAPKTTETLRSKKQLLEDVQFFWLDSAKLVQKLFPWKLHAKLARSNGPRVLVNYLHGQKDTLINKRQLSLLCRDDERAGQTLPPVRHPATACIRMPAGVRRWASVDRGWIADQLSQAGVPGGDNLVILKPVCWSRSDGITVARGDDVHSVLSKGECFRWKKPARAGGGTEVSVENSVLVQHYLHRPLLWQGHKFDLRVYLVVLNEGGADGARFRAWLHPGYARCCASEYRSDASEALDQSAHVTNWCRQKTHARYNAETDCVEGVQETSRGPRAPDAQPSDPDQAGDDARGDDARDGFRVRRAWPELRQFLDDETPHGSESVLDEMTDLVSSLMRRAAPRLRDEEMGAPGQFSLLGLDVMVDVDGAAWLIECNGTPQLEMHPPHLKRLHTRLLEGMCSELFSARAEVLGKDWRRADQLSSSSQWELLGVF
jgi:hypothetical protein